MERPLEQQNVEARFVRVEGLRLPFADSSFDVFASEGALPEAAYFAVTEEPSHTPNANRIAFWVPSREEVDRIAALVREAGGQNVEGPESAPYSKTYYAVFFEDPSASRLEVYHRSD